MRYIKLEWEGGFNGQFAGGREEIFVVSPDLTDDEISTLVRNFLSDIEEEPRNYWWKEVVVRSLEKS